MELRFLKKIFYKQNETELEDNILKDLEKIIGLFVPELDPSELDDFNVYKYLGKITFRTDTDYTSNKMKKLTKLESLRIEHIFKFSNEIRWEADYNEYKRVHLDKSPNSKFIERNVKNALNLLSQNFKNSFYSYVILQYSTSIHIVLSTLKDSKELNGFIDAEVERASFKILKNFSEGVINCEKEYRDYLTRDKEAANKSHLERLAIEDEYVNNFIIQG